MRIPQRARGTFSIFYQRLKNKFLYRGKIWVDAKDFAVVRIEGEPAKNPSIWIKKTEIAHLPVKVDNFGFPRKNVERYLSG